MPINIQRKFTNADWTKIIDFACGLLFDNQYIIESLDERLNDPLVSKTALLRMPVRTSDLQPVHRPSLTDSARTMMFGISSGPCYTIPDYIGASRFYTGLEVVYMTPL